MEQNEFEDLMRIQRSMAGKLRTENELDRKVELISLIQSMVPDKKGRILTEQIIVEAVNENFSEEEIDPMLDQLEKDGYLKRVEQGIMMLL